MRKSIFLLALAVLPALSVGGETSPNERFSSANQLFEKGDLEKAGEIYSALTAQGFQSAELFYNLGNLHYRKGGRGRAVLWYERALRLNPRDADISFNLALARSHIKDEGGPSLRRFFTMFTGNELSALLAALIWFFFSVLGTRTMGWIKNDNWPGLALWVSGLFLAFVTGWFGVVMAFERQPEGIVINPPGEVRNGPGTDYAVGFTIPEGSKVLLLNQRPDWTQVGVPDQGLKGWMPNGDVEAIRITPVSSN